MSELSILQLWTLADELGPEEWKQVGTTLGYSHSKLKQFEMAQETICNAIYSMLEAWCNTNKDIDQIAAIKAALREAERNDLADKIGQTEDPQKLMGPGQY